MSKTLVIVCILLVVLTFSVAYGSDIFGIDSPVRLIIEPVPMPSSAGTINLRLTVIGTSPCEKATVAITGLDNLKYEGDTSWTYRIVPGDTNVIDLGIIIPENDTSGIGITTRCAGWPNWRLMAFFTADSGGVKFYNANPRGIRKSPKKKIDMSDPPMTDEMKQGKSSVGYYDEDKNWVPEDSVKNGLSPSGKQVGFFNEEGVFISLDSLHKLGSSYSPDATTPDIKVGDSSKTWLLGHNGERAQVDRQWLLDSLKDAKTEAEYEDKIRREEKPCTYSSERIVVDGEVWQRRKGEYKFQKAKSYTDTGQHQREFMDSVRAVTPDTAYHISLDLRVKADSEFVAGYIDSIFPMEREGFYDARAKRDIVIILEKTGIKFAIYPSYPGDRPSMPQKKNSE